MRITYNQNYTECYKVLNLPAQYLENARVENHGWFLKPICSNVLLESFIEKIHYSDIVLEAVATGQQSSFTLPNTSAPSNQFYGLKSANGACMFIENGKFSLFNDETGNYAFSDTVSVESMSRFCCFVGFLSSYTHKWWINWLKIY